MTVDVKCIGMLDWHILLDWLLCQTRYIPGPMNQFVHALLFPINCMAQEIARKLLTC